MPLLWRVFLPGAVALVVAAVALLALPVSIGAEPGWVEVALVGGATAALLAVNLLLTRRALAPIRRLTALARDVDLLEPGQRLPASSAGDMDELVKAFNQMLERLEHERADSAGRLLLAQEGERRRIAHDLHDQVGQTLTAVLLQLKRAAESAPPAVREDLRGAQAAARSGLEELSRVVRRLRPEALDDLGLASALTALCTAVGRHAGIAVERRIDHGLPALPPETELVIYRVAQEALTNVGRHADATRAVVTLEARPGAVALTVSDDGIGMRDPQACARGGGGIRGMRERALLVAGNLNVEPAAEGGVRVELTIPLATGTAGTPEPDGAAEAAGSGMAVRA